MTWVPTSVVAHAVDFAGFLYDPTQDIIYSRLDALQRKVGYNVPYDYLAVGLSMFIDSEPFYFDYGGRHWLIEPWKGQYGLESGGEIGVYVDEITADSSGLPPALRHYACVSAADQLTMSFTLYRNGEKLFTRGPESHWWLTGFKWGVFTPRSTDIWMDIEIVFPKTEMRDAFKKALVAKSYITFERNSLSIAFTYDSPRAEQPVSRRALEGPGQIANEHLVERYNELKKALGLPSNDPNAFTAEAVGDALLDQVPYAIRVVGRTAVNILEQRATDAARRFQGEANAKLEEAKATYRDLVEFVHNLRQWRMH
jgi:hypothetical protein